MRRLLLIGCLLIPSFAHAAWTVTNDKQALAASVTFTSALSNPSTTVAVCREAFIDNTTSVTDTAGNTYVDSGLGKVQVNSAGPKDSLQIFIAANTYTTASNIVTCNNLGTVWIEAFEITGCTVCGLVDGAAATVNLNVVSTGPNAIVYTGITTEFDGNFIFATGFNQTVNLGWSAGTSPVAYTLMPAPITLTVSEYATQTTHGAIAPTMGITTGTPVVWGGMVLGIRTGANTTASQIGVFITGP